MRTALFIVIFLSCNLGWGKGDDTFDRENAATIAEADRVPCMKIDWASQNMGLPNAIFSAKNSYSIQARIAAKMTKYFKEHCDSIGEGLPTAKFLAQAYDNCQSICMTGPLKAQMNDDFQPKVCNPLCTAYIQRTQGFISGYNSGATDGAKNCTPDNSLGKIKSSTH